MVETMMKFAERLVLDYGAMLRKRRALVVEHKADHADLVSDMDTWIEQQMIAQIHHMYPDHTFLCEESEKVLSDQTWILDPIDGTTNYISKHRDFAISLAYYKNKKPVFGFVYDVMQDELFSAIHARGAWCNGVAMAIASPKKIEDCILDISMGSLYRMSEQARRHMFALYPSLRGHRSLNCASLAICHIAQGIGDAYVSNNVKCWDYAAAILILEESKGAYTIYNDFFTTQRTTAYFACTRAVLKQLIT